MNLLNRVLILNFMAINLAWAGNFHTVPKIDRTKGEVGVKLINKTQDDLFCQNIEVEIRLRDKQFGEPMGSFTYNFSNAYVIENSQLEISETLSGLGLDESNITIDNLIVRSSSCVEANFQNYCEHHPEVSTDDSDSIRLIMNKARTTRCSEVEASIGKNLYLKNRRIVSFKPFTYLRRLKSLHLQENLIESLSGVEKLKQLKVLKINGNPIENIDQAIRLPNIRWVDASRTNIYQVDLEGVESHMKKSNRSRGTHVFDTPYSRGEIKPKPTSDNTAPVPRIGLVSDPVTNLRISLKKCGIDGTTPQSEIRERTKRCFGNVRDRIVLPVTVPQL